MFFIRHVVFDAFFFIQYGGGDALFVHAAEVVELLHGAVFDEPVGDADAFEAGGVACLLYTSDAADD